MPPPSSDEIPPAEPRPPLPKRPPQRIKALQARLAVCKEALEDLLEKVIKPATQLAPAPEYDKCRYCHDQRAVWCSYYCQHGIACEKHLEHFFRDNIPCKCGRLIEPGDYMRIRPSALIDTLDYGHALLQRTLGYLDQASE